MSTIHRRPSTPLKILTNHNFNLVLTQASWLILLFVSTLFYSQYSVALLVSRGPYLQTQTASSVVVRWRTDDATDSVVHYGSSPSQLNDSVTIPGRFTEHIVTVSGLAANTRFYYAIGNSTTLLEGDADYSFVTAPTPGSAKPTRIWVIGDSGTADEKARAVRDAYKKFTGDRATDLWLMLGDNAYKRGTDKEYQNAVFDAYPTLLQQIAVWPVLGNHDGKSAESVSESGPYYDIFNLPRAGEAGGLASGTEAYYSFDYGNIHLIALDSFDSDRSVSGSMLTWLENDLLANDKPWVIAFWHHPPYSKGWHDSDKDRKLREMRENAVPILENYGVDLVLSGHNHSYERSMLIDGHYGKSSSLTPDMIINSGSGQMDTAEGAYSKPEGIAMAHEGTVYVVAGSSGKLSGGPLNHPVMYTSLNLLGSMVIDVNGNQLDARFLDVDGTTRDHFTLLKGTNSSNANPLPVSVPNLKKLSFQEHVWPDPSYQGVSDSYLSQHSPDKIFGKTRQLRAEGEDSEGQLSILLQWNLSAVPANAVIQSASITVDVSNASDDRYPLYQLFSDWSETEVTWNHAQAGEPWSTTQASAKHDQGSTVLGYLSATDVGSYTIDINEAGRAVIQSWINANEPNYGFIITSERNTDGIRLSSSETPETELHPKLDLTFSLTESDGNVIDRSKYEWGLVQKVTHEWQRVRLAGNYTAPVVVANAMTYHDAQPGVIRLRNVTPTSFELRFAEWDYLNDLHLPEDVSFLVVDSGCHYTGVTAQICAGKLETNKLANRKQWEILNNPKTDAIFSAVQTENNPKTVATRVQHNKSRDNFSISMIKQESGTNSHATETLGWIAIDADTALFDLYPILANSSKQSLSFSKEAAKSQPVVIGTLSSLNGYNPAIIRFAKPQVDSIELFIEEERSLDREIYHRSEEVSIFVGY